MNRIGRFMRDAPFATGAKAISVAFIVAMIALFTTSLPTGEVALVPAPVAVQQSATTVVSVAARTDTTNPAGAPASRL